MINHLKFNKLAFLFCLIALVLGIAACKQEKTYTGYRLIEKKFVKEVNADCYLLEHEKSGARILKIAANDPNKTFSIAFKTFPESDCGTPHILEHSVLNGSKNFPVKSPFEVLSKGSLNTFINAFTGNDFTMYPEASMNNKDYFNLMHVYLDAVFNPLIYTDKRILKQEGWHYELLSKDAPIEYKGVVYNEMKGAFSDPSRVLNLAMYRELFPDNAYRFESGGYPEAIPTLTQEAFEAYHQKHYHPENSYIVLYGDADLEQELKFIDENYLSKYTKTGQVLTIEDQKPFDAPKEARAEYPAVEGQPTQNQTYLTLSMVCGQNTDEALTMGLDLLADILVNQESAPIRLALQEAGIGQDVYAGVDKVKQNVFQINVQNANESDKAKFKELVYKVLNEQIAKGINKQVIQGAINRTEFSLREGNDAQKGLTYAFRSLAGEFFAKNPFLGLEYEKPLAEIKKALTSTYLEDLIKNQLVNNNHTLLLALVPKPGLDKEMAVTTEQKLKAYKASLDDKAIETLVNETNELIAFQKSEDTPEALATIPMLSLKDIDPKAMFYEATPGQIDGIPMIKYEDFTNNVVYMNLYFDMRALSTDMIPWASLMTNVLGSMNTTKHTYAELDKSLNINTGGFYTSLTSFTENMDDAKLLPKFVVTAKAMNNQLDSLFNLTAEILNTTQFDDTARLHQILIRHQSQLDGNIKSNGFQIASGRLESYFSQQGLFEEITGGIEYYRFITGLLKEFKTKGPEIVANLQKASNQLFTKENMMLGTTLGKDDFSSFEKGFVQMAKQFKSAPLNQNTWNLQPSIKNEGILTASAVQYVVAGFDFKQLGYTWDAKMRVLNQILSNDYLQTQVRVIGGAYGGFCNVASSGLFALYSYRDPNLGKTLDVYNALPAYLDGFTADEPTMTRYIIGTIATQDAPLTNQQKGERAFNYYFTKRDAAWLQRDRDAILATTATDIKNFSKLVTDVLAKKAYCVYGNADKVKAEAKRFDALITPEK